MKIIKMGLSEKPFWAIKNNQKTIEVRLNDKKRQQIEIGDIIEFAKEPDKKEFLKVKVVELLPFPTFRELYETCGAENFRNKTLPEFLKSIYSFYTEEEEKQYGVLGIRFVKLK